MRKLKIGFVFDDSLDKTDGIQQYVLALGSWLSTQGHEVHYLVGETKRTDLKNVHSLSRNVRVNFNGNRLSMPLPASSARIRDMLERQQFDVLHVQVPYSPWMAAKVITLAPKTTAIIGTFHVAPYSSIMTLGAKFLAFWTRRSLKRFDNIVSVSKAAADFAQQTYGISTPIVPNVVDYARFNTAMPFEKYKDKVLTILFLGRLVPRKGCSLLLEAITLLQKYDVSLPRFRVLICGTGPLEQELKGYVSHNNLGTLVEFAGFVQEDDKPRFYASADIGVFPSSGGESFGIVLLEAMASGKAAVVAGNNPGYASVMADKPELLIDTRSPQILATRLKELLANDMERNELAHWGAKYAARFDTQAVGAKLVTLYEQALHSRRNLP